MIASIMGFWAIAIAYTLRANLSFAITKMVTGHDDEARETECLADGNANSTEPVKCIVFIDLLTTLLELLSGYLSGI